MNKSYFTPALELQHLREWIAIREARLHVKMYSGKPTLRCCKSILKDCLLLDDARKAAALLATLPR